MSDYYSPTEDELMMQLAAAQQGGADPNSAYLDVRDPFLQQSKKLDYLKKIADQVGVPFMQLLGVSDQAEAPQVSQTRQVYSANPALSKAFDAIDAGYDPYSVTAAYLEDSAADPSLAGIDPEEFRAISEQYAKEKLTTSQAGQASYTKADGSKWKGAPLGGNDVLGTASEYELMGAPTVDEGLKLVAQTRAQRQAAARPKQGGVLPEWAGAQLASVPKKTAGSGLGRVNNMVQGLPKQANKAQANEYQQTFDKFNVEQRLKKAQGTQVRSDANNNLMRRMVALASLVGA